MRRDAGLIQLLDPPFDQTAQDPGYIRGYVPGVRENGGQYTHAAIWATMAFAQLGDTERAWELLLLALAAPLMRPEGALGSALIACAFARGAERRALSVPALAFIALPPAIYFLFTGHATQTTTLVKWLPFNPYLTFGTVIETIFGNARLFWSTLLDGQLWSAAYIPEHSRFIAWLALPSLIVAGQLRQRSARAWLLVALGFGILIPTTYDSFLWNRLRYLWPFAGPWLIGLIALADQLGEFAALVKPRWGLVRYLVSEDAGYLSGQVISVNGAMT